MSYDLQKHIRIRYRTDKLSAYTQMTRHVLHHHSRFASGFEGVVHAELHCHIVIVWLIQTWREYVGQSLLHHQYVHGRAACNRKRWTYRVTIMRKEVAFKGGSWHALISDPSLFD